jgi:DNA-binding transcriptional MerR regulator
MKQPSERLLTTAEVCRLTALTPRTLQRYRAEGYVKWVPIGSGPKPRVRYTVAAVAELIARQHALGNIPPEQEAG